MNQLIFIETFVLGAATIAAIYHLVLYIQQRDKFLAYYSAYLFSLATYIGFKLWSNNYDPFAPTDNVWYYVLEEVLQVCMVTVYVLFAAVTLEVVEKKSIVRNLMYVFFAFSTISIVYHIYGAMINGAGVKSVEEYALSRVSLVGIATVALLFAWRIRSTTFQRTIIVGSLVYDFSGLLSIISFVYDTDIFGLKGVEPYLIGCLVDIIIFSSALGYRLKTIADQKNELLKKEIEARLAIENTRMRIAIDLHDDVGSVLSSMSIYSEAAKKSIEVNNIEKASSLLEQIGFNARETMSTMSDIVWTINPLNDTGAKLFNRMEAFASGIFSSMDVNFTFHADRSLVGTSFEMPIRQNIYYIFKEAITNCAKHSGASAVSVKFTKSDSFFVMVITENGKKFDGDKDYQGNGLKNMRHRAKAAGGTLSIERIGLETVITFKTGIEQSYRENADTKFKV